MHQYSNQAGSGNWTSSCLKVFTAVYSCLKLGVIEHRLKEGFSCTRTSMSYSISPVVHLDFYQIYPIQLSSKDSVSILVLVKILQRHKANDIVYRRKDRSI